MIKKSLPGALAWAAVFALALTSADGGVFVSDGGSENQYVSIQEEGDVPADEAAASGSEDSDSLADHSATVYAVLGHAEVLKKGSSDWAELREGDIINEGDRIRTDTGAYVDVSYDDYHLNTIRVEADSEAEFRSIEETDVYLTKGSVYNQLDGLVEGSNYEVSTPTSVAAVRGTHFARSYDPELLEEETFVTEGEVQVAPFDASGRPDFQTAFSVTKDKELRFDRPMIENRSFANAQPRELSPEHREKFRDVRSQAKRHLENFAGGPEKIRNAHERFDAIKNSPEARQAIRKDMMDKNGPQGPHRPMFDRRRPGEGKGEGRHDGNVKPVERYQDGPKKHKDMDSDFNDRMKQKKMNNDRFSGNKFEEKRRFGKPMPADQGSQTQHNQGAFDFMDARDKQGIIDSQPQTSGSQPKQTAPAGSTAPPPDQK